MPPFSDLQLHKVASPDCLGKIANVIKQIVFYQPLKRLAIMNDYGSLEILNSFPFKMSAIDEIAVILNCKSPVTIRNLIDILLTMPIKKLTLRNEDVFWLISVSIPWNFCSI
jgi:hypothetical protein